MIAGRKTSISIEDAFWGALKEIARFQRIDLSELVTEIAATRKQNNLSSAIRVFVLDYLRNKGERTDLPPRAAVSNHKSQSSQA